METWSASSTGRSTCWSIRWRRSGSRQGSRLVLGRAAARHDGALAAGAVWPM